MAPGAAKDPAAGNDRAAHHTAAAGISEDCARRISIAARRQIAVTYRDIEIPEAAGAASATASATAAGQAWARRQGGGCGARSVKTRGQGQSRCTAQTQPQETGSP